MAKELDFRYVTSDGNSVTIDAVKSLNTPFGRVLNGKNIKVFGDGVEGDYATAFMQNGAVASDVYNFNSKTIKFGVEQANSLFSGDINFHIYENLIYNYKYFNLKIIYMNI